MKLWELASACRGEMNALERISEIPEWSKYLEWMRDLDGLSVRQERDKLDRELPYDLCRIVLSGLSGHYYLSESYVRVVRKESNDREISAVDVFDLYGGEFLEDVNEAGLAKIPPE